MQGVGGRMRMRAWGSGPRGRMRRWRASSARASLCHLLWSGHWLLLAQHSGWSLPVLTSAVAFVGGGDLFECTRPSSPTQYHQVSSTLVADSRYKLSCANSHICTIWVCLAMWRPNRNRAGIRILGLFGERMSCCNCFQKLLLFY